MTLETERLILRPWEKCGFQHHHTAERVSCATPGGKRAVDDAGQRQIESCHCGRLADGKCIPPVGAGN